MRDFMLTLSAVVVALGLVLGLLFVVASSQPTRQDLQDQLTEIEARQIRIEQLLTYGE